jgi:hypothetical protein
LVFIHCFVVIDMHQVILKLLFWHVGHCLGHWNGIDCWSVGLSWQPLRQLWRKGVNISFAVVPRLKAMMHDKYLQLLEFMKFGSCFLYPEDIRSAINAPTADTLQLGMFTILLSLLEWQKYIWSLKSAQNLNDVESPLGKKQKNPIFFCIKYAPKFG